MPGAICLLDLVVAENVVDATSVDRARLLKPAADVLRARSERP
jgi:hypothetical protein